MPIKTNRKIALSKKDKLSGEYVTDSELELKKDITYTVYLEAVEYPLLLIKQIFKNNDGTKGVRYLVSSDQILTYDNIIAIYQRRWKVERYHKSMNQQVALGKSLTKRVRIQSNQSLAAIYGFFKLEFLSIKAKLNQTAPRSKTYILVSQSRMQP